jgi:hypothetical protein
MGERDDERDDEGEELLLCPDCWVPVLLLTSGDETFYWCDSCGEQIVPVGEDDDEGEMA